MEIEMPEHPLAFTDEGVPTIGAFYDALLAAFKDVDPTIDPTRQLTGNVGAANQLVPMTDLGIVEESIALIKEQGEGTGRRRRPGPLLPLRRALPRSQTAVDGN